MLEAVQLGRKAADRWLLDQVSLTVRCGQRVGIVGASGSGKTLLLRALAALDPLDAGVIRWRGDPVGGSRIPLFRSQVTYLHQRPTLVEGTVEQNLQLPYSLRVHRDRRFDRSQVLMLLRSVGREAAFLAKQQRDLSGGESQLTALIRAMQLDPLVLLLDEPTAALDPEATEMVESLVSRWIEDRPGDRATIWVTHDPAQARRMSDALLRMRDGSLQEPS